MIFLLLALFVTGSCIVSTVTQRIKGLERKADQLELRLGLLLEHFGIETPEPTGLADVRALAAEGRTVQAVKAYREATGAGLVEAKRAVEALQAA